MVVYAPLVFIKNRFGNPSPVLSYVLPVYGIRHVFRALFRALKQRSQPSSSALQQSARYTATVFLSWFTASSSL